MDKWGRIKHHSKKMWQFFWHEDSIWSWIANIIVAFLVIRYLVYPILGVILGTSFPIVAVVSESMEHGTSPICVKTDNGFCVEYSKTEFQLCGETFGKFDDSFENYWEICGEWYLDKGITEEQFRKFPFKNGFDKGDVIILWRANKVELGDVLVFQGNRVQPIIHRVVKEWEEDGKTYYQTKGDHNPDSIQGASGETKISEERIFGKGVVRIPYLGWVKILFVDAVRPLGINIQR